MRPRPLFALLAETLAWQPNEAFEAIRAERLKRLVDLLPSGSGIDTGTKLDDSSKPDRLVLNLSFHHMNETGMYDGWTDHQIIVKPSLANGFDLRITGRDRNQIKDYLADTYHHALRYSVEVDAENNVKLVQ